MIVEVNGGAVTNVWNAGRNWAVLDWDNLLGDGADTVNEWNRLSRAAREFIRREYPQDFAETLGTSESLALRKPLVL